MKFSINFLPAVLASFRYWQRVGEDLPKSITQSVLAVVREGIHCKLGNSNI